MTDKNEPKTYIIDKFKKSYSSIQEIIAEESRNFAQYAVIIDRLLAEFETYDKIKSLDIKEYAIKIFSELDQLKAECEEWKSKYYHSTTETKADLIKQIEELKKDNDEIHEKMATVIYRATGGHLSYSTYTLDAIEQAREDRLAIDVKHKTEEYREVINQLKKDNEELEREIKLKKDFINSLRKHYERKLEEKKLFLPSNYKNLYEETKEMKNDIAKKYFDLEKENKKLKSIIKQAIEDFNLEIGTPQYEILLNKSKELGVIKE